ncbi:UNVERIFIED_ORG: hypothetical protein B2H98_08015 [Clostridium botulinum]
MRKQEELIIEYASRIKFAEIKEDWDRCLNGRWYNSIYNCDHSDIAQIMERLDKVRLFHLNQ